MTTAARAARHRPRSETPARTVHSRRPPPTQQHPSLSHQPSQEPQERANSSDKPSRRAGLIGNGPTYVSRDSDSEPLPACPIAICTFLPTKLSNRRPGLPRHGGRLRPGVIRLAARNPGHGRLIFAIRNDLPGSDQIRAGRSTWPTCGCPAPPCTPPGSGMPPGPADRRHRDPDRPAPRRKGSHSLADQRPQRHNALPPILSRLR